jgi:hypothetical protein
MSAAAVMKQFFCKHSYPSENAGPATFLVCTLKAKIALKPDQASRLFSINLIVT